MDSWQDVLHVMDDLKVKRTLHLVMGEASDVGLSIDRVVLNKVYQALAKFLWLKLFHADYYHQKISPGQLIDEAWHSIILSTQLYRKLCERLLGHDSFLIEHYPLSAWDSDKEYRLAWTAQEWQVHFGEEMPFIIDHLIDPEADRSVDPLAPLEESQPEEVPAVVEATPPQGMQLFVKSLNGYTWTLNDVSPTCSVEEIKQMIYEKSTLRPDRQRVIFAGMQLEDGRTIDSYRIQKESTLHLIERLTGC